MAEPEEDAAAVVLDLLYSCSRTELRRIAWEALLISDGPAKVDGDVGGDIIVVVRKDGFGVTIVGNERRALGDLRRQR